MVFTTSCDFCNSPIIDLFLPCTIVTLVDNWLPSRLISSQLSRLRLLGISSERWGKYLVFSYSFESFFMLKVVLLVLSEIHQSSIYLLVGSDAWTKYSSTKRLMFPKYFFFSQFLAKSFSNLFLIYLSILLKVGRGFFQEMNE